MRTDGIAIPLPGSQQWLTDGNPVSRPGSRRQDWIRAVPAANRYGGTVHDADRIRDRVTLSSVTGADTYPRPLLYDRTGRLTGSAKASMPLGAPGMATAGTVIHNYHVNVLVLVNAPADNIMESVPAFA